MFGVLWARNLIRLVTKKIFCVFWVIDWIRPVAKKKIAALGHENVLIVPKDINAAVDWFIRNNSPMDICLLVLGIGAWDCPVELRC